MRLESDLVCFGWNSTCLFEDSFCQLLLVHHMEVFASLEGLLLIQLMQLSDLLSLFIFLVLIFLIIHSLLFSLLHAYVQIFSLLLLISLLLPIDFLQSTSVVYMVPLNLAEQL